MILGKSSLRSVDPDGGVVYFHSLEEPQAGRPGMTGKGAHSGRLRRRR
jgi:hypothetical protein